MSSSMASDEVIDLIADIEVHRQGVAKEAGLPAACSGALRRLHELLDRETKALQVHGPDSVHAPNVAAVKAEIERVKKLGGISGHGSSPRGSQAAQGQGPRKNESRPPSKDRARRAMGRGSR
jgi:hypothetical protein